MKTITQLNRATLGSQTNKSMSINLTMDKSTRWSRKPSKWEIGVISQKLQKTYNFESLEQLALHFTQPYGFSWCPAIFEGGRANNNWFSQQVFALDSDEGITPKEAYQRFKSLGIAPQIVYTTFSDKPEFRKFRLIFVLSTPITDSTLAKKLTEALLNVFSEGDAACSDLSRMYFGGKKMLKNGRGCYLIDNQAFINILTPFFTKTKKTPTSSSLIKVKKTPTNTTALKNSSRAFQSAVAKTEAEVSYVDGSKAHYIAKLAGRCNRAGISFTDFSTSVITLHPDFDLDRAEDIYSRYASDFGSNKVEEVMSGVEAKSTYTLASNNQKVSDLNIPIEELANKVFVSPTGSGKTYNFVKYNSPAILVVPTTALTDEIGSSYGVNVFNGETKQLPNAVNNKVVVTYSSYPLLAEKIGDDISKYYVAIDEAHNLTVSASSNYLLPSLSAMVESLKNTPPKAITLMTATPVESIDPLFKDMEQLVVKNSYKRDRDIVVAKCVDKVKFLEVVFRRAKEHNAFVATLLNNTKNKLDSYLSMLGDFNIETFSSAQKNLQHFQDIIATGQINPDTDGYFTTTVLKEGNSFYLPEGKTEVMCVVDGSFSIEDVVQFANRWRNAEKVTVIRLVSDKYESEVKQFNYRDALAYRLDEAQSYVDDFNTMLDKKDSDSAKAFMSVFSDLNPLNIKINELGLFEVDFLAVSNAAYEDEKRATLADLHLYYQKAKSYGFTVKPLIDSEVELTEVEEAVKKDTVKAKATIRREQKDALIDTIFSEDLALNSERYEDVKDAEERNIRFQVDYIYRHCKTSKTSDEIKEIYYKVSETTASWNAFVKSVKFAKILTNSSLKGNLGYKLLNALRDEFKVGEELPREAILTRFTKVYNDNIKFKKEPKITKSKAVKFLRLLFNIESRKTKLKNRKDIVLFKFKSFIELPFEVNVDKVLEDIKKQRNSYYYNTEADWNTSYNIGLFKV